MANEILLLAMKHSSLWTECLSLVMESPASAIAHISTSPFDVIPGEALLEKISALAAQRDVSMVTLFLRSPGCTAIG